jgi:hypothetical protein
MKQIPEISKKDVLAIRTALVRFMVSPGLNVTSRLDTGYSLSGKQDSDDAYGVRLNDLMGGLSEVSLSDQVRITSGFDRFTAIKIVTALKGLEGTNTLKEVLHSLRIYENYIIKTIYGKQGNTFVHQYMQGHLPDDSISIGNLTVINNAVSLQPQLLEAIAYDALMYLAHVKFNDKTPLPVFMSRIVAENFVDFVASVTAMVAKEIVRARKKYGSGEHEPNLDKKKGE